MEVPEMSSILRALKKLEKTPEGETAFKPWQRKADAQRASGRSSRGAHLSNSSFYIFLAAPFLLIGGWLLLEYGPTLMKTYLPEKTLPRSMETRKNFAPTTVKTQSKPAPKRPPTASSGIRKAKPKTRKTVIASRGEISVSKKRVINTPPKVKKTRVRARSKPLTKRPQAARATSPDRRIISEKTGMTSRRKLPVSRKDQKFNPPQIKPRNSLEAEKATVVKSKGESGFEVQAIAWSRTPAKRIAVINSQVVHEGDSVDGATVSKIDMDDVSIIIGNKTLLIKCGR